MIELLIKVIAALLNGVSRYRSFVYKSANGASWEVLFRFENDPSDERYGGGLALLSARFALNTDTMQLSNISPVSFVQFTTSRTTYFTRNAAGPDSVSVESPPLLDGMGKPYGGTAGGVRLLPRPWLVSNGANPKAFAMGGKEQAAIEASMKSDPKTRHQTFRSERFSSMFVPAFRLQTTSSSPGFASSTMASLSPTSLQPERHSHQSMGPHSRSIRGRRFIFTTSTCGICSTPVQWLDRTYAHKLSGWTMKVLSPTSCTLR
jgi:hypothetical protein